MLWVQMFWGVYLSRAPIRYRYERYRDYHMTQMREKRPFHSTSSSTSVLMEEIEREIDETKLHLKMSFQKTNWPQALDQEFVGLES